RDGFREGAAERSGTRRARAERRISRSLPAATTTHGDGGGADAVRGAWRPRARLRERGVLRGRTRPTGALPEPASLDRRSAGAGRAAERAGPHAIWVGPSRRRRR